MAPQSSSPTVLVTGATGGIGEAICRRFADAGWTVVVGYRSASGVAEQLADELDGVAVSAVVDDSQSLAAAARLVEEQVGRLDTLVNNAGVTRFVAHDDLEGLDDALFDQVMTTNVRGPFACIRAFRRLLDASPRATIVNITSLAARTGNGSNVAYCASKAALDSMTRSLGRALAPSIRVISVSPGLVDTDFIPDLDDTWRAEQAARTPLGRLAEPGEVAEAVWASVAMLPFTTGSTVAVDGGRGLT